MEKRRLRALRKIVYALDAVIVLAALYLSFLTHDALLDFIPFLKETPAFRDYVLIAFLSLPVWLILVGALRLQQIFERHWTTQEIFIQLLKLEALGLVALVLAVFLTQSTVNRSLIRTSEHKDYRRGIAGRSGGATPAARRQTGFPVYHGPGFKPAFSPHSPDR